jgi:predicted nucleotidyltransferase component of viral defense system
MGKIQLFNREQKIILDEVKKSEFLSSNFYFTGGTALRAFYLQHRYSEDLDFFSLEKIDQQAIFALVENWSKKYNFVFESRFVEVVYIFTLVFKNKARLKLDFSYYPYKHLEKPILIDNIHVDSLTDIAVNKLLTISQRNDVKDFVDLYYLLQQFSLWDLKEGVKIKFNVEIEPLLLASDFLKIEDFTFLPRMIKPLTLNELKSFYREKAKELGKKSLE